MNKMKTLKELSHIIKFHFENLTLETKIYDNNQENRKIAITFKTSQP